MLRRVLSDFPDISFHTIQMYSEINPLVLLQDQSTIILTSEEGVHQRDPLGPMLFSLGIQSLLCDVQSNHPSVTVLAYLDDVFLIGSLEEALASLDDLKSSFSSVGLRVAEGKSEVF